MTECPEWEGKNDDDKKRFLAPRMTPKKVANFTHVELEDGRFRVHWTEATARVMRERSSLLPAGVPSLDGTFEKVKTRLQAYVRKYVEREKPEAGNDSGGGAASRVGDGEDAGPSVSPGGAASGASGATSSAASSPAFGGATLTVPDGTDPDGSAHVGGAAPSIAVTGDAALSRWSLEDVPSDVIQLVGRVVNSNPTTLTMLTSTCSYIRTSLLVVIADLPLVICLDVQTPLMHACKNGYELCTPRTARGGG